MSTAAQLLDRPLPTDVADGLRQLATLPDWLTAALQPNRVIDALARHAPEFASGELRLRGCKVKRLTLKDTSGRWAGSYNLAIVGGAGLPLGRPACMDKGQAGGSGQRYADPGVSSAQHGPVVVEEKIGCLLRWKY
jgi:hypothetical protein